MDCNKLSKTIINNESEDDNSDNNLEIDLDINQGVSQNNDFQLIETIEDEIGKKLNEKAEKTNLTVTNVKTIIRQVLTNEHVMALLNKDKKFDCFYEPKLTRAKAKQLLCSTTAAPVPWVPQPAPSETHVLVADDLQDDSSGDEYIPGEEESEEDRDDSIASELDTSSLPPPTPPAVVSMEDSSTQTTHWSGDGVFKVPKSKTVTDEAETANIALRTRSKINLSSTPLEVIEKSFIPPDITTDMYDMDCDDDDWKEFLKGFTEPLDEIAKPTEDEEQDPEYNILADDEIDNIEREEFREDRAVKISKKEIKELWEELFEYIQNISEEIGETGQNTTQETTPVFSQVKVELEIDSFKQNIPSEISQQTISEQKVISGIIKDNEANQNFECYRDESSVLEARNNFEIVVTHEQLCIIEQQMRQHVQILTQNFLLMYDHPELHENCAQLKEYLLSLKFLSDGKSFSLFRPVNLEPALKLIEYWVELFASNGNEVKQAKAHVRVELSKSLNYKSAGNYHYVSSFPKLIVQTILNSEVFLYPFLLPKIPFKSLQFIEKGFTNSEDELIVMGLEQFSALLKSQCKKLINKNGQIPIKTLVSYIREYMMPHRNEVTILKHIMQSKCPRNANNPIRTYFLYKKVISPVHYIYPLHQILPLYMRNPDEMPLQWRIFLKGEHNGRKQKCEIDSSARKFWSCWLPHLILVNNTLDVANCPARSVINGTILRNNKTSTRTSRNNKLISKKLQNYSKLKNCITSIEKITIILVVPINVRKLVHFFAQISGDREHLPDLANDLKPLQNMPLLSTPASKLGEPQSALQDGCVSSTFNLPNTESLKTKKIRPLDFSNISFHQDDSSTEVEFSTSSSNFQISQTSQSTNSNLPSHGLAVKDLVSEKDTSIACSTPKPIPRKEPSGAEKKKARIQREFLANLSIATPEDPQSVKNKDELFAIAYYDKLRETLDLEDYHKILQILNEFKNGDAVDLYRKVEPILQPKYMELAEEFLLFLKEKEAALVGQLIPWFTVTTRVKFLRKLEIYFKEQPAQLKKIYNMLTELSESENLDMETIKRSLLPLLKGNGILTDLFLQNFVEERPPASLLQGPYETININKELTRGDDEELYEKIVVPNTEEKYGGISCDCHCHKIEDNEYKCRYKHCISCGLRFVQGKVFIQTGRGMQPACITFKTNPKANHVARLMGKQPATVTPNRRKRRADSSPNKNTGSSGKENLDEDTEDEEVGKRRIKNRSKPSRKRIKVSDTQSGIQKVTSSKKSLSKGCDTSEIPKNPNLRRRSNSVKKGKRETKKTSKKSENLIDNADKDLRLTSEDKTVVKLREESVEVKNLEPVETEIKQTVRELEFVRHESGTSYSLVVDCNKQLTEKSLTPMRLTTESESEFCEESSQDNYESDSSCSSMASNNQSQSDSNTNDEPLWGREEDTIILETFQREDDKDYALQIICDKLPNKTISQIRSRFSTLMTLLIESLKSS
ncbi:uncharacterized protein LOC132708723 isoform X2 [Cylas formicarius]|uniref:uncharacterized protein LOC132708723 isoform X2 n=1 Tax=Cylas formicarius TaxID=197179 RepID=UPI002958B8B8|nr:uncharacterized protein LOC132708723 isoform X2 [Cylas formicarius]